MKKGTAILLAITCFFVGMCGGLIISPDKHGVGGFGNTMNIYLNGKKNPNGKDA